MRYKLSLSLLSGTILGVFFGWFYYTLPAELLILGPLPMKTAVLSPEIRNFIFQESLIWGIIPGILIGLFMGFNTNATMPRGHLSASISAWCCLVCMSIAWITQWNFLSQTSAGRIALTIIITFMIFLMSLQLGQAMSFIEKIREKGGICD